MNATVHQLPEPAPRTVQVAPARFVTIELAETLTGYSQAAIRTKIARGVWIEGREWIKRDGRVHIDMRGYERWVEAGQG